MSDWAFLNTDDLSQLVALLNEYDLTVEQLAQLLPRICLLYTSDAADERSSVDLGGRRIIKKKNTQN